MKTKTINIYSFSELSESAKDHAIRQYREGNTEIFWQDEILESLKGLFEKCTGVSLKNWSLGDQNSWIKINFTQDEAGELSGKRAMAWIENNLLVNIRIPYKGKRREELRQYGKYYRAGMIPPCPFTCYCADDDFLDSILKDIKEGADLQTAFQGLASEYQKIINDEIESQNSEEYIADHFDANEYEFDQEGNRI